MGLGFGGGGLSRRLSECFRERVVWRVLGGGLLCFRPVLRFVRLGCRRWRRLRGGLWCRGRFSCLGCVRDEFLEGGVCFGVVVGDPLAGVFAEDGDDEAVVEDGGG